VGKPSGRRRGLPRNGAHRSLSAAPTGFEPVPTPCIARRNERVRRPAQCRRHRPPRLAGGDRASLRARCGRAALAPANRPSRLGDAHDTSTDSRARSTGDLLDAKSQGTRRRSGYGCRRHTPFRRPLLTLATTLVRGRLQAPQYSGRVTKRIRAGVDCEHSRIGLVGIARSMGRIGQDAVLGSYATPPVPR